MNPERARPYVEGFAAGLIGYAVVAAFFGVVNLLSGRSVFYTAAALGMRLAGVEAAPGEVVVAPGPVFAYNGVHLLAFLVIGLAAAWLVHETELHPGLAYLTFFAGLSAVGFALLLFLLLSRNTPAALSWWSVLAANLLAGTAIAAYLLRAHRGLLRRVDDEDAGT